MAAVLLLIAASGFVAAVAQVVLVRELLVVFDGNELVIGLLFAAWLFWVAIGSLAGRLVRGKGSPAPLHLMLVASALLSLSQVLVVRSVRHWLGVGFGEMMPILPAALAASMSLAPVCLLVGAQFSVACYIAARRCGDPARKAYVAEGAGFAVGGVVVAFLIVPHLSSIQAGLALIIFASLASWAAACLAAGGPMFRWGLLWLAAALAFAVFGGPARLETASLRNQWRPLSLLESVNSPYGNIVATRRAGHSSFFVSGKYIASAGDPLAAEQAAHMCLLQHPRPRSVLLIGGSAAGIIPRLLSHHVRRVVYIELDPRLIALVRRHSPDEFTGFSDPRAKAAFADARRWCRQASERFDLILLAAPEPATILLTRYYTLEFFRQARRLLTPSGVLALSLPASADYFSEEDLALQGTVYRTLSAVFPHVLVTPTEQRFFFASAGSDISLDPDVLIRRFEARQVRAVYFHPYLLHDLLQPDRAKRVRATLRSVPAPLTTDFSPIACFRAQRSWNLASGSIPPAAMEWLDEHPWQAVAALLAVFAVLASAGAVRRGRSLAILGGLAAFGMAGMVVEVALLLAFQVIWGYLYAHLGLIVAAFMVGMVVGALIPGLRPGLSKAVAISWPAWQVSAAAYLVFLPHAIPASAGVVGMLWFYTLVLAAGLITGLAYPLGVALLPAETGGRAYGADLLGACLGALAAGAFLLPVLGLTASCYSLAALFALLLLLWPAARIRRSP